jgi:hypothetical protein
MRSLLWSSGQSSGLQIQRSGFDSRRYQIFWELVGLERGPLSLVSTIEKLLGRKRSGSGLENKIYRRRDPSLWPRGTLYPQKLAITSPTSCGRYSSLSDSGHGVCLVSLDNEITSSHMWATNKLQCSFVSTQGDAIYGQVIILLGHLNSDSIYIQMSFKSEHNKCYLAVYQCRIKFTVSIAEAVHSKYYLQELNTWTLGSNLSRILGLHPWLLIDFVVPCRYKPCYRQLSHSRGATNSLRIYIFTK